METIWNVLQVFWLRHRWGFYLIVPFAIGVLSSLIGGLTGRLVTVGASILFGWIVAGAVARLCLLKIEAEARRDAFLKIEQALKVLQLGARPAPATLERALELMTIAEDARKARLRFRDGLPT